MIPRPFRIAWGALVRFFDHNGPDRAAAVAYYTLLSLLPLLIFVINRVGVQPLFDALLRIGVGFFVILGLSGLRHVLRTVSMRAAVPAEHRKITFRQAFAARLGGEAISFLTFTGPLLGEATKVALLRKRVPGADTKPAAG